MSWLLCVSSMVVTYEGVWRVSQPTAEVRTTPAKPTPCQREGQRETMVVSLVSAPGDVSRYRRGLSTIWSM
jgi:hypothetical protein